jgi:hypothetical protein
MGAFLGKGGYESTIDNPVSFDHFIVSLSYCIEKVKVIGGDPNKGTD